MALVKNRTIPEMPTSYQHEEFDVVRKIIDDGGSYHGQNYLRKHQVESLHFVKKWFGEDSLKNSPAVLVLPTGTGKSIISGLLPYFLKSRKVVVVTPSVPLTKDMARTFGCPKKKSKESSSSGVPDMEKVHAKMVLLKLQLYTHASLINSNLWPKTESLEASNVDYSGTLSSAESLVLNAAQFRNGSAKNWLNGLPWHLIDLLIVDEAHHFPASYWNDVVNAAIKHSAKVVFLTASPYRTDGKKVLSVDVDLPEGEFWNCYKDRPYFYLSIEEAVQRKLIRQFRQVVVENDFLGVDINIFRTRYKPKGGEIQFLHMDISKETDMQRNKKWKAITDKIRSLLLEKNSNPEKKFPGNVKHSAMIMIDSINSADQLELLCKVWYGGDRNFKVKSYHSGVPRQSSKRQSLDSEKPPKNDESPRVQSKAKRQAKKSLPSIKGSDPSPAMLVLEKDQAKKFSSDSVSEEKGSVSPNFPEGYQKDAATCKLHKRKFENGKVDVLIVVESLREGYDNSKVSVVGFCCEPTSPSKIYQFMGRGVRVYMDNNYDDKNNCDVVFYKSNKMAKLYNMVVNEKLVPVRMQDDEISPL